MNLKNKKIVLIWIALLLIIPILSLAQVQNEDALESFKKKYGSPGLKITVDKELGLPRLMSGLAVSPPKGMKNPKGKEAVGKIVFEFLRENKKILMIDPENVKEKSILKFQNKWYITLQTYYKGIIIYRGQVGFTLDEEGKILTYSTDYNPDMEIDVVPKISKEKALEIAYEHHKPEVHLPVTPKDVYLMIYQERGLEGDTTYRLSWHIFLETQAGHQEIDRVFFIDAKTGDLIKDFMPHPFAITGNIQGEVYPEHSTDPVTTVPFEHEEVSVPGSSDNTNASGNYSLNPSTGSHTLTVRLEGPYVRVQSYNTGTGTDQEVTHTATVSNPGTYNFTWTSTNCAPDDGDGLNVFWQANRLHDDYYQAILGINWTNSWTGTSQMRYSVNRGSANNASCGNPIKIYSNAAARNCDITFHESTHNVLYHMFGSSYIGWPNAFSEGYAFDEGFSDYVACSFNNDEEYAENVHTTRHCNNTMLYPGTTYNIEGHTGGQLISGVAWDLWNKEGLAHNATDVLLFAGLSQMSTLPSPYYFSNPSQSNYFTSLLTADDNNNNINDGTPNDRQIFQAFRNHDLLPIDVFCKDSPQDDGHVPSKGHHWTSPDIWIRHLQDGVTIHQNPKYNQQNYLYVRVRNLGYLQANTITVKAYWADPAGGIPWPSDWNYIGETTVTNLAADNDTVITPIPWTPTGTAIGHRCLLVRLECSQDMMTEEGQVKLENNISQKNITIELVTSGPPSEVEPIQWEFFIKNYLKLKLDLIFNAIKVEIDDTGITHPIEGAPVPFKTELIITGLEEIDDVHGGEEEVIKDDSISCIPPGCVPPVPTKKIILNQKEGKISNMRFRRGVNKAFSTMKLIPVDYLNAGEAYEVTIAQSVNNEIVGGLTYIIKIH